MVLVVVWPVATINVVSVGGVHALHVRAAFPAGECEAYGDMFSLLFHWFPPMLPHRAACLRGLVSYRLQIEVADRAKERG